MILSPSNSKLAREDSSLHPVGAGLGGGISGLGVQGHHSALLRGRRPGRVPCVSQELTYASIMAYGGPPRWRGGIGPRGRRWRRGNDVERIRCQCGDGPGPGAELMADLVGLAHRRTTRPVGGEEPGDERLPRVVREDAAIGGTSTGCKSMSFLGIQTGHAFRERSHESCVPRGRSTRSATPPTTPSPTSRRTRPTACGGSVIYPVRGPRPLRRAPTPRWSARPCASTTTGSPSSAPTTPRRSRAWPW